jgi:LysR family transcriptional regulator, glycine cleavage system transcriptional activator
VSEERALPLIALRVLEAGARHRNFTRAAEELGITPGAVTQHVHALEEWAGVPLFIRSGREFLLSEPLELALEHLSDGFQRISHAARILRSSQRSATVVSVSAPPAFTAKWLLPRLDGFRAIHADAEVWISADLNLVDFNRRDIDLAIRYGSGNYGALVTQHLFGENVVPVAAPHYLAQHGPIGGAGDLLAAQLLHDVDPEASAGTPDWTMWFRTRGITAPVPIEGPRYNQSALVIDEAVAGKGIALARRAIAQSDIDRGALTIVLPDETALDFAYWLVWPRNRNLQPLARAFATWLIASARDDATVPSRAYLAGS